jgi:uncharacterized protein YjbI with pentapeptide repeats
VIGDLLLGLKCHSKEGMKIQMDKSSCSIKRFSRRLLGAVVLAAVLPTWNDATRALVGPVRAEITDQKYQEVHELGPGVSLEDLSFKGQSAVGVDLSGANLSSSSWEEMDLSGASFVGADVQNSSFFHGSLRGANFRKAKFNSTLFAGVDLTGADLSRSSGLVEMWNTSSSKIVLRGANLSGLTILMGQGSGWSGVDLRGANLANVSISYGSLAGADLTGASLKGANFGIIDWTGVTCPDGSRRDTSCLEILPAAQSDTSSSDTESVEVPDSSVVATAPKVGASPTITLPAKRGLSMPKSPSIVQRRVRSNDGKSAALVVPRASLKDLVFDKQNASFADLSKADLRGSKWSDSLFINTDFSGADLSGAVFIGGSFVGADFGQAKLDGVTFIGSVMNAAVFGPGSKGEVRFSAEKGGKRLVLRKANLVRVTLAESDFSGADLREADLRSITMTGGSFAGADLSGALLTGAKISGADWKGVRCRKEFVQDVTCVAKGTGSSSKPSSPTTPSGGGGGGRQPGQCVTYVYGVAPLYYDNGAVTTVEGKRQKCKNGFWVPVDGGSGSGNSGASVIGQECDLRESGMSSSFYGQRYSWFIYDVWSDGRRTAARFGTGSGYADQIPPQCF